MIKGVIIGIVSGFLLMAIEYLFVVKENQVNISNIQHELTEIKSASKEHEKSLKDHGKFLVATKLFIAQAHPDRDISSIASIQKFGF